MFVLHAEAYVFPALTFSVPCQVPCESVAEQSAYLGVGADPAAAPGGIGT